MSSYQLHGVGDVEIQSQNGSVQVNSALVLNHADNLKLKDINDVSLSSGDLLGFYEGHIIAVPYNSVATVQTVGSHLSVVEGELTVDLSGLALASDLSSYLLSSDASSTYATQTALNDKADTSALNSYVLTSDASSTYATHMDLNSYLLTSDASSSYATLTGLNSYLLSSDANTTYAAKSDLSPYLLSSDANSTYANKTELSSYLDSSDAASIYLTSSDAASTYALQSSLSNYVETSTLDDYTTSSVLNSDYLQKGDEHIQSVQSGSVLSVVGSQLQIDTSNFLTPKSHGYIAAVLPDGSDADPYSRFDMYLFNIPTTTAPNHADAASWVCQAAISNFAYVDVQVVVRDGSEGASNGIYKYSALVSQYGVVSGTSSTNTQGSSNINAGISVEFSSETFGVKVNKNLIVDPAHMTSTYYLNGEVSILIKVQNISS